MCCVIFPYSRSFETIILHSIVRTVINDYTCNVYMYMQLQLLTCVGVLCFIQGVTARRNVIQHIYIRTCSTTLSINDLTTMQFHSPLTVHWYVLELCWVIVAILASLTVVVILNRENTMMKAPRVLMPRWRHKDMKLLDLASLAT